MTWINLTNQDLDLLSRLIRVAQRTVMIRTRMKLKMKMRKALIWTLMITMIWKVWKAWIEKSLSKLCLLLVWCKTWLVKMTKTRMITTHLKKEAASKNNSRLKTWPKACQRTTMMKSKSPLQNNQLSKRVRGSQWRKVQDRWRRAGIFRRIWRSAHGKLRTDSQRQWLRSRSGPPVDRSRLAHPHGAARAQ